MKPLDSLVIAKRCELRGRVADCIGVPRWCMYSRLFFNDPVCCEEVVSAILKWVSE